MKEIWRPIPGFERYAVSSHGRVKNTRTGNILKPYAHRRDREYYKVQLCQAGRSTRAFVHRLVAAAFLGDIPVGYTVHHRNARRDDNRLSNLQIVTRAQNTREALQRRQNAGLVQLPLFVL